MLSVKTPSKAAEQGVRVGDVLVESSASRKGSRVHFETARPEGDEAAAPVSALAVVPRPDGDDVLVAARRDGSLWACELAPA